MNIEQLNQQVVINEWQLGQQLNTAVHNGTRDKFNLLLSLLSEDARDFAQFSGQTENEEVKGEQDLRAYFELPQAQPLVNEGPSEHLLAELNNDLQNTNLTDIRFKQLLTNEAILSKKETGKFPQELLENLPLLKKQRISTTSQSTLSTSSNDNSQAGVNVNLLDAYKKMDLANRPLQVRYS